MKKTEQRFFVNKMTDNQITFLQIMKIQNIKIKVSEMTKERKNMKQKT